MNFRIIAIVTVSFALAVPVIGQVRRGGFGAPTPLPGVSDRGDRFGEFPGAAERNLDRLEAALDLTPSQVASLEALREQLRVEQEGIRSQMQLHRPTLQAAIENRDAIAIGDAVLALHDLRTQLGEIHERFRTDFRNLLTLDQVEQLDALEAFAGNRLRDRPRGRFGGRGERGAEDFTPPGFER